MRSNGNLGELVERTAARSAHEAIQLLSSRTGCPVVSIGATPTSREISDDQSSLSTLGRLITPARRAPSVKVVRRATASTFTEGSSVPASCSSRIVSTISCSPSNEPCADQLSDLGVLLRGHDCLDHQRRVERRLCFDAVPASMRGTRSCRRHAR